MMNLHKDGSRPIFVFGSNEAGRHGAGAAREAYNSYGAVYGQGVGMWEASYAIPTKDHEIETLPLEKIRSYVADFIHFVHARPDLHFHITAIGCGLAGYTHADIAPMFKPALPNCSYPAQWAEYLA